VQPSPPPPRYFSVAASLAACPMPPTGLSSMSRQNRTAPTTSGTTINSETVLKKPAISPCGIAS
jgi:hypothetical protein